MAQRIILSLFDYTGIMVAPWAAAGFLCYCVDLQHRAGENREGDIIRVGADVREWLPPYAPIKMLFAFGMLRLTDQQIAQVIIMIEIETDKSAFFSHRNLL